MSERLHRSHKVHRNVLYGVVVLLLVLQVISFVFISGQVSRVNSNLEKGLENTREELRNDFNSLIRDYNEIYTTEFTKIENSLSEQQESLDKEISLLKSSQNDFSGIIEDVILGVVSVGTDKSAGTGFVVNSEGWIVTNYHVVENANQIQVLTSEKKVHNAQLIGFEGLRDIALLKINSEINELELADSDDLQVGKKVIAIGNPLGLSFSVTEGIISAIDREGPNGLDEYIQTDVSLNPGNSGGPLIDTQGEVIGINNFKIGDSEGLGFALEADSIKESVNAIANQTIVS
jgi:serine protease Do